MTMLRILTVVAFADAIIIMFLACRRQMKLTRHLATRHPETHRQVVLAPRASLAWGWHPYARFVFMSDDDLGDPEVATLKKSLRRSFYGFFLNGLFWVFTLGVAAFLLNRFHHP